jgi:ubiquinone/menaquinone biosynthesis C-methylase UbiE
MKLVLPVTRFAREFDPTILEMMDRKDPNPVLLKEDLENIRQINRFVGAYRLIQSELDLLREHFSDIFDSRFNSPITFLDLCTGSGDIPRLMADWARSNSIQIKITATDINPFMLDTAKELSRSYSEIKYEEADILNLRFSDKSFDFVFCNLALHHFSAEQAVIALKNMWNIARKGILVNDLERKRSLRFITKYLIPLVTSNPITRYDADLSVRRAFTNNEMLRLAFHAKLPNPESRRYFFGRQVLSAMKL